MQLFRFQNERKRLNLAADQSFSTVSVRRARRQALSPDALSAFAKDDPEVGLRNKEVRDTVFGGTRYARFRRQVPGRFVGGLLLGVCVGLGLGLHSVPQPLLRFELEKIAPPRRRIKRRLPQNTAR